MIIGIIVLVLGFIIMVATGVPFFGATAIVFVGWGALILIAKIFVGIRKGFATPEALPKTAPRSEQVDRQAVSQKAISPTPPKAEPVSKGVSLGQFALWILIAASLLWCTVVFYQYRNGPYVTTGKALVDCIPFILLIGSVVGLFRLTTPVNDVAVSDGQQQNIQRSSNMTAEQQPEETQPSPLTHKQKSAILAAIAVGAIVSTFLPWFHISGTASFSGGSINMSGITIIGVKGDGMVGLIVGVISLIMALCRTKWSTIPGAINVVLGLMFLLGRNTGGLTGGANTPGIGLVSFVLATVAFAGFSLTLWKKEKDGAVPEAAK